MKKQMQALILLFLILLLTACRLVSKPELTLDDFEFLEKGMNYKQVVKVLGEPLDIVGSASAIATYIYDLEDGNYVYLCFLAEADYLDGVYYLEVNEDSESLSWLIPASQGLPPGIQRHLVLSDFDEFSAGMEFFPDIYRKVGPPNISALFEGGDVSLVYYLGDDGRIAMITHGGYKCISLISHSPESFGKNWTVLSEDTEGLCEGE